MFLRVLSHPGSPGQRAIKRLCVCLLSSGIYHDEQNCLLIMQTVNSGATHLPMQVFVVLLWHSC